MKKWKIGFLIVGLGITLFIIYQLFICIYVLFPWAVPWVGDIIVANPPKPQITYGEFPISITYEVNGEIKVVEDTVICEFDGIERRGESGKYRKWKAHREGGDNNFGFFPIGKDNIELEVGIYIGSPNYYMGDFEQSREAYEKSMADDRYREYVEWRDGVKTGNVFTKEEVWEKYRFRIIDIQYSPPIENTFK